MKYMEFKSIPGYENYGVTKLGHVKHLPTGRIINPWLCKGQWAGYYGFDTANSKTQTLTVHRAVALAWIPNDNPDTKKVVNHLDGITSNNSWKNLEWTTYSGNNYHAVNTGLRPDNIRCRIRDFETGEIFEFPSMSQAASFMGLENAAGAGRLLKKKFGSLILGRYEFKFEDDSTPWFYESRSKKISARYMVIVRHEDGAAEEVYSQQGMLKRFQLYKTPYGKSIPELVRFAIEKYPEKDFILRDSYTEERYRVFRNGELSEALEVKAEKDGEILEFPSITRAAKYFHVDRKSITRRLDDTNLNLNGWVIKSLAA